MTQVHDIEGVPDLPSFKYDRTGATVEIEPCPDGEHWHWTWHPDEPPESVPVETGYMEIGPNGPQPHYEERPWEPQVNHLTVQQVLNAMSPEESRLFMGWCSHVSEQLTAHLHSLVDAAQLSVAEKRWDGLAKLAQELHIACLLRESIASAGRTVFDLT